jgi:hypothetical protein
MPFHAKGGGLVCSLRSVAASYLRLVTLLVRIGLQHLDGNLRVPGP